MLREDFVQRMMPHALAVSRQTGLDPRLVIAQSALETGWGKSAPGNNFFGIKSHGQPGGNTMATTEVVNGQPVQTADSFRAYGGMGDSADDYAAFLKRNPRYAPVLAAQGLDAQVAALGKSGYATDPDYGSKISAIASGISVDGSTPAVAANPAAAPPLPPPIGVASVGPPAGLLAPSPPDPATPDAQDPYAQMAKGLLAQSAPASRQQDPFAGDAPTASLLRPTAAPQFRGIQPMTRTRRFA